MNLYREAGRKLNEPHFYLSNVKEKTESHEGKQNVYFH